MNEVGDIVGIYEIIWDQRMNDYCPCYIDGLWDYLPIFIGKPYTNSPLSPSAPEGTPIGLYIRGEDFYEIDHTQNYIFYCYPQKPTERERLVIAKQFSKLRSKEAGAIYVQPSTLDTILKEKPGKDSSNVM